MDELRGQLDPELVAYVEPTLRKILDVAKPKTVTQIEYRSDPKDQAEIESLRATLHAKDEAIRKLENKLADHPPAPKVIHPPNSPDHLSRKQRLEELNARAKAFAEWARRCMELMSKNEEDLRERKQLLTIFIDTLSHNLCNYLSLMEGLFKSLDRADMEALPEIVNQSAIEWLTTLEEEVHAATDVKVDLELFLKGQEPPLADPETVALLRSWPTMPRPKQR